MIPALLEFLDSKPNQLLCIDNFDENVLSDDIYIDGIDVANEIEKEIRKENDVPEFIFNGG